MIERFNFYDLYGYLIPGVALIIVALVPFPILGHPLPEHTLPEGELSALVLGVVVAYVLGHFIQSMAHNAFESKVDGTYPSTSLLDPTNHTFSPELKQRIAAKALGTFQLDLSVGQVADSVNKAGSRRQDAFFLARSSSNPKKTGSYSEQHQGLYSMMRGLSVALALGFFYTLGWVCSPWKAPDDIVVVYLGVATFCALVLSFCRLMIKLRDPARKEIDRESLFYIAVIALLCGYLVGGPVVTPSNEAPLFLLMAFYVAACMRFFVMYRFFSVEFAMAIWRSFGARK